MGVTSGAGPGSPSEAPKSTPAYSGVLVVRS
jgi:hypothetical protein